jgi:hypothetical protein
LINLYCDSIAVNAAVGQSVVGKDAISERTLYNFRERLYKHTAEHPEDEDLMFGQFRRLLESFSGAMGTIMELQRLDTTMFMSNIKKSGRLSLAHDVLAQGVKKIPEEKLTEELKKVLEPGFKNSILYRSKNGESESRLTLLLSMCGEALEILLELPEGSAEKEIRIMRRLLEEQTTKDEEGNTVVKKGKEISASSLQSAYDEEATYRVKGETAQSGYVLSVSETCSKDNPVQLITDYAVESNNTADTEIARERMGEIASTGCEELYGDGGF